jgi:YggT family protein
MSLFNFNGGPLCVLGNLYVLVLIARAILSWFPIQSNSPFLPVARFLNTVTEPVLAPFRRIIPPAGMFDMSFLVAVIVVEILTTYVLCKL